MPKGPALFDPLRYPDRVRQRRNVVLALMAEQNYITAAQKAAAQAAPLVTSRCRAAGRCRLVKKQARCRR